MQRALELARGGRGQVSPNPLVGAVVVRDGETIGEGFHAELGGLHAELDALADCERRGEDPRGATVYVTLEPCAHVGRQPPCAPALVDAGVGRVVIASDDPSEHAAGAGPEILREAGIEVAWLNGAEASVARALNQSFRKRARTGIPHVTWKTAASLDGRTATREGDSRWISGEESRESVHRWRAEADAVAIGIGTALADDPLLTARDVHVSTQPLRVVFDSHARLPLEARLIQTASEAPLLVATRPDAPADRVAALREAGAEVTSYEGDGPDYVRAVLAALGAREISSLILEGGATLAGSFLDAGEVDELRLFVAPVILGGDGIPLAAGDGAARVADAVRAVSLDSERSGDDILITARLREW
jgi:diaminohydroxyphosphoribosylaminopyrimidine deaminase/5-amino-6-(5-phosphoribosylamino)uracil reductase